MGERDLLSLHLYFIGLQQWKTVWLVKKKKQPKTLFKSLVKLR